MGYTLRRLAAKCTNLFAIKRSKELQPSQVGVGESGGAEAAVHAARCLLLNLPDNHVFVRLDFFSSAFNSVRRDAILTLGCGVDLSSDICLMRCADKSANHNQRDRFRQKRKKIKLQYFRIIMYI